MPTTPKIPATPYVICDGRKVQTPFNVVGWARSGYEFRGRNRTVTKVVVNHATGAENPPSAVYKTLLTHATYGKLQPLSIHFVVDRYGEVYQMADTAIRCVHAQDANAISIGIEFICRLSDFHKVPDKGVKRERVKARIHGVEVEYDELTPEQIEAGVLLNEFLCGLYALPMVVPENPDGSVYLDQLSDQASQRFVGCTAHLHWHPEKYDAGAGILRAIQARGRQLAPRS